MNFKVNESNTKLRGGYYTDPDLARFLAQWVVEIAPEAILEPSCGDGVFIEAIAGLQYRLTRFEAFEIEAEEASKFSEILPSFAINIWMNSSKPGLKSCLLSCT